MNKLKNIIIIFSFFYNCYSMEEKIDSCNSELEKTVIILDKIKNEIINGNLTNLEEIEKKLSIQEKKIYSYILKLEFKQLLQKYFPVGITSLALNSNTYNIILEKTNIPIYAVDLSKDGKFALTGSADGSMKIWDLIDNKHYKLGNYSQSVPTLIFNQKNNIASLQRTTYVNYISFWHDKEEYITSLTLSGNVCIAMITDLILISQESTVLLFKHIPNRWGFYDTKQLAKFSAHSQIIKSVDLSQDSKFALAASDDKIIIWNITNLKAINKAGTILGNNYTIQSAIFSPCSRFILFTSSDNTAHIWDIRDLTKITQCSKLLGHTNLINSVKYNNDGNLAITGSKDGTIKLWNIENPYSPTLIKDLNENDDAIFNVAFGPQNEILAGTWDNGARLWYPNKANILEELNLLQIIFLIKFFKNYKQEDLNHSIFNSFDPKIKRYIFRLLELRKVLSHPDPHNIVLDYLNDDLIYDHVYETEFLQHKESSQSSSCATM